MENRVTPEQIKGLIENSQIKEKRIGDKTTVVCLILPNGFEITETASCVDPANYDEQTGKKICLERIEKKLWELEGYKLQCQL